MREQALSRLRIGFTAMVTIATLAHLVWQHTHGGVPSHHFLHRADMPAISNWWGALVLPLLCWYLVGRAQRRIFSRPDGKVVAAGAAQVIAGFASSLAIGVLLSASFAAGHEPIASYVLLGALVLALLLPAYRAECVLGFVLGMAFTFGAVLPTIIGSAIAALSAAVHLYLLPIVGRAWRRRQGARAP